MTYPMKRPRASKRRPPSASPTEAGFRLPTTGKPSPPGSNVSAPRPSTPRTREAKPSDYTAADRKENETRAIFRESAAKCGYVVHRNQQTRHDGIAGATGETPGLPDEVARRVDRYPIGLMAGMEWKRDAGAPIRDEQIDRLFEGFSVVIWTEEAAFNFLTMLDRLLSFIPPAEIEKFNARLQKIPGMLVRDTPRAIQLLLDKNRRQAQKGGKG